MKNSLQKIIDVAFYTFSKRFPTAFWVGASKSFLGSAIEYVPPPGSRLSYKGSPIKLIVDSTIFPYTFAKGHWQFSDIELILSHFDAGTNYTFVDIGANIGLFSRQIFIAAGDAISAYICVEPETRNFSLLQENLAPFADKSTLLNAAVSATDGTATLHLDPTNIGHHSFIEGAAGDAAVKVDVQTISGTRLTELILARASDSAIVIKCDTEGFDEYILCALGDELWARVDVVLVEISRCRKPPIDWDRFVAVLSRFARMHWADAPTKAIEAAEVIALAKEERGSGRDLVLIREL